MNINKPIANWTKYSLQLNFNVSSSQNENDFRNYNFYLHGIFAIINGKYLSNFNENSQLLSMQSFW